MQAARDSPPGLVRIGCSGWNYADWRHGVFYPSRLPERRWLEHYASRFDTVEVNSTFYRLPRADAVAHWVEQTPPGFLFAVKASRYLTHVKRLRELPPGLGRLLERLAPLATSPKLGPFLWQLPPRFRRDDERLAAALAHLPAGRHGFEFRHASWFCDEVYALLHEHGAALVIGDRPEVHAFQALELTAGWTYVRFHFGSRGRRGSYSESELRDWAARIDGWRTGGTDVYAYFNNDWEGFAPRNAVLLRELLGIEPYRGGAPRGP